MVDTRQPCAAEQPPAQHKAAKIDANGHLTKPCLIIDNPEYYELKSLDANSRAGSYDTVYSESVGMLNS